MKRPTGTDFVLGHRAAVLLATGAAAAGAVAWIEHKASAFVPLTALLIRNVCAGARGRITAWRAWTEAWEAMQEPEIGSQKPEIRREPLGTTSTAPEYPHAAPPDRRRKRVQTSGFRLLISGFWLLLLGWFMAEGGAKQTPGDGVLALCFVALTGWGVLAAIIALWRWCVRPSPQAAPTAAREREGEPDDLVTQCLPPARTAPLPDYARTLLARGREGHPSPISHPDTESEQSE